MARVLVLGVAAAVLLPRGAADDEYEWCEATYALCFGAPCVDEEGTGDEQSVTCICNVLTGWSMGPSCPAQGEVVSRWSPEVFRGPTGEAWPFWKQCEYGTAQADCMNVQCEVVPDDPTLASCVCPIAEGLTAPYFTVASQSQCFGEDDVCEQAGGMVVYSAAGDSDFSSWWQQYADRSGLTVTQAFCDEKPVTYWPSSGWSWVASAAGPAAGGAFPHQVWLLALAVVLGVVLAAATWRQMARGKAAAGYEAIPATHKDTPLLAA